MFYLLLFCTGIAEVMGSNPAQAWFFFRFSFRNCFSYVHNCDDLSCVKSLSRSSNIWHFIYPLHFKIFVTRFFPHVILFIPTKKQFRNNSLAIQLANAQRVVESPTAMIFAHRFISLGISRNIMYIWIMFIRTIYGYSSE